MVNRKLDIRDRYDELENFLDSLSLLKSECQSKDLIDEINNLLYASGYDDEKQELEEQLIKIEEQEEREMNLEYESLRI